GGGGGEGAGNYQLVITEYDRKLTMAQGETKLVKVTVKNTGLRALEDVGLIIASKNNEISSTWYRINVSTTGLATEDLSSGETVVYNVRIILPSSALSKTYAGTWRAKDKDSLAIAERGMNLTITQVWTTTTIAALNNSLTSLEKIFADLEKNFTLIKGSVANVSQFETTLKSINGTIKQSRASFDSGAYDDAKSKADQVSTDISKFVADIEVARSINPAAVIIAAFTSLIGIVILVGVAVAASLGGFFIWWMFFRIISIGEVKRNPAKFAGGVRLAGAVKSITDTKKGKVFLIADTSGERLHVRYPYYTTTEVGDLIKVGGVVKIYKDIPYMDATELSRVTMKPTTTK
ncbi:TPA: hypothetical protein H1005_03685, partial [archaeon]|nr:hypothetical protein [Candidatus Naiadarchaeales archaeon SRR2090153.bin1042]